ncbi:MAG: hypothetical protein J6X44_01990 [Thermoguttaceae bacterium]|nr:hypothetical protein [Thermoguttaceae bacterium]
MGVENQSEVDYAMPVRNMRYDASHYVGQMEAKSREHKKTATSRVRAANSDPVFTRRTS